MKEPETRKLCCDECGCVFWKLEVMATEEAHRVLLFTVCSTCDCEAVFILDHMPDMKFVGRRPN